METFDRSTLDELTLQDLLDRLRRLERRRNREPRFSPAWRRADDEIAAVARRIFHHGEAVGPRAAPPR